MLARKPGPSLQHQRWRMCLPHQEADLQRCSEVFHTVPGKVGLVVLIAAFNEPA
jgi:hypothetical protein